MSRLVRDGKVAVLVSPGYGAGWYTSNKEFPECLFDADIAKIVLGEVVGNIEDVAYEKYGEEFYLGGFDQLKVEWVLIGDRFRIKEYDGSESLILAEDDDWHIAEAE